MPPHAATHHPTHHPLQPVLVLLKPAGIDKGAVLHATLRLQTDGTESSLLQAHATGVDLNCSMADDPTTRARLDTYHERMVEGLAATTGYLAADLRAEQYDGNCVSLSDGLGVQRSVCGCRVAECGLGNLAADAMRWVVGADVALINGGSIRATLHEGAVTQTHLVQVPSRFSSRALTLSSHAPLTLSTISSQSAEKNRERK